MVQPEANCTQREQFEEQLLAALKELKEVKAALDEHSIDGRQTVRRCDRASNWDRRTEWPRHWRCGRLHLEEDNLARAIQLLRDSDALADTIERARQYARRAIDALAMFPGSKAKAALIEAAEFAVARAY